jgi:catechol 2,3-dioxygenase-like lactoylglutathione lyase family enzyme
MKQRVSVVTLGVADVGRARAFYEALGWRSDSAADSDVAFFQSGGAVLSLWGRDELAADSGVELGTGFGAVTLASNVASPEEVRVVIEQARAAGATVTREPGETVWGGYSAVFADPDGHPWEVAHNPHWALSADGNVTLSPG